jgi:hypothetical protein
MALAIRPVRPVEAGLVFALVRELAAYERLRDAVDATEAMIDAALFAPNPRVFCDIAEWDGEPVAFALWFPNFSSFRGRHGIGRGSCRPPSCAVCKRASAACGCRHNDGRGVDALRMNGARLERAVDRVHRLLRRRADRMDGLPPLATRGGWRWSAMMDRWSPPRRERPRRRPARRLQVRSAQFRALTSASPSSGRGGHWALKAPSHQHRGDARPGLHGARRGCDASPAAALAVAQRAAQRQCADELMGSGVGDIEARCMPLATRL